jgi:hypothetical protein
MKQTLGLSKSNRTMPSLREVRKRKNRKRCLPCSGSGALSWRRSSREEKECGERSSCYSGALIGYCFYRNRMITSLCMNYET